MHFIHMAKEKLDHTSPQNLWMNYKINIRLCAIHMADENLDDILCIKSLDEEKLNTIII